MKTAVEWLEEIYLTIGIDRSVHFNQAKEMEREQIIDFAYVIADDLACGVFRDKEDMEKRYEEFLTFRTEEDAL